MYNTHTTCLPCLGMRFLQNNLFPFFRVQNVTTQMVFLNGPSSASFLFILGLFKQTIQILQQIYVKKCPSSIWCRNLNLQPSDFESPP